MRGAGVLLALVFLLSLPLSATPAAVDAFELRVGRFEHPAFVVGGLELRFTGGGAPGELRVASLSVGGREWKDLRIRCGTFRLDGAIASCRAGTLVVPGVIDAARVDFRVDTRARSGTLNLRGADAGAIELEVRDDRDARVRLTGVDVARIAALVPELARWQPQGRLDARAEYVGGGSGRVVFAGELRDGGFASADGLRAAEKLCVGFDLRARRRGEQWDWDGRVAWNEGEAYLHPVYLAAGPALVASGRLDGSRLSLTHAKLDLEGVRSIDANGSFDLAHAAVRRLSVSFADADLAVVGPRFLAPALAPANADRLRFEGHVSAAVEVENDAVRALDIDLDAAGFRFGDENLSFGPASGRIPWRADTATLARLAIAGGRWQKLALGSFEVAARLDGPRVALEPVRVPVLDGAIVADGLSLLRATDGWHGAGALVVEPVSMSLLTEALALPAMAGVLSASLPGLRIRPGEVSFDGALVISVFDGYLRATRLQLLEPFGVAPHLYADVEARAIDLEQLTDTFSFGSITGRVDADVVGLELANWRPVRFDARIASSPGSYRRRISQRAVRNISALGGGGAAAALQRGVLGLFDTFGYRDIGVSCVLRDAICEMAGLGRAGVRGEGFYLVRGGGVPALNVIGYNRRVDWNELIDRLQRVIESSPEPVIE